MEKFIVTENKAKAEELIKKGYMSLFNSGDLYIFENTNELRKLFFETFSIGEYVFSNKMFI